MKTTLQICQTSNDLENSLKDKISKENAYFMLHVCTAKCRRPGNLNKTCIPSHFWGGGAGVQDQIWFLPRFSF